MLSNLTDISNDSIQTKFRTSFLSIINLSKDFINLFKRSSKVEHFSKSNTKFVIKYFFSTIEWAKYALLKAFSKILEWIKD